MSTYCSGERSRQVVYLRNRDHDQDRPLGAARDKRGDLGVVWRRKDGLSCLSLRVSAYIHHIWLVTIHRFVPLHTTPPRSRPSLVDIKPETKETHTRAPYRRHRTLHNGSTRPYHRGTEFSESSVWSGVQYIKQAGREKKDIFATEMLD